MLDSAAVRPVVQAISPAAGPLRGGNVLVVKGSGFDAVRSVTFGATASTRVTHVSDSVLRVTVPAHAAGSVHVRVRVGSVDSSRTARDVYRFTKPPADLRWSKPTRIDPDRGALTGVACGSATSCITVDRSISGRTRLIHFGNGSVVAASPTRVVGGALACGRQDYCVAGSPSAAWFWTSGGWHGPRRLGDSRYDGPASCATATAMCLFLGQSGALVHTGGTWHAVAYPKGAHYTSVSCATATFCEALGAGVAGRFDGTRWHRESGAPHDYVESVSCTTRSFCLASTYDELVTYDGVAWQPPDQTSWVEHVAAVSCRSETSCLLSDYDGPSAVFDGTSVHQTAIPGAGTSFATCVPGSDCVAVDDLGQAYHFDGQTWSRPETVTAAAGGLTDVSCTEPHFCVAVDAHGLALRYSSGHWSKPTRVDARNPLVAVSCTPQHVCVAVDAVRDHSSSGAPSGGRAVMYANGHWSKPVGIDSGHALTDVSCVSATYCVAVDEGGRAITMRGSRWSEPKVVMHDGDLQTIDCTSPRFCLAGGYRGAARWDGTSWHRERTSYLSDIDCLSPSFCAAGGSSGITFRHDGVWSRGAGAYYYDSAHISCLNRRQCFGYVLGGDGDPFDSVWDGDAEHYRFDKGDDPSCVPRAGFCMTLDWDSASIGRA